LGASGDGPEHRCRFSAKWRALGADAVTFVDSELTNIAMLRAGRRVFVLHRGTWTDAQDANNRKECAVGWGGGVGGVRLVVVEGVWKKMKGCIMRYPNHARLLNTTKTIQNAQKGGARCRWAL
jgi:hypothetical protein